jgi:hypothetical protein
MSLIVANIPFNFFFKSILAHPPPPPVMCMHRNFIQNLVILLRLVPGSAVKETFGAASLSANFCPQKLKQMLANLIDCFILKIQNYELCFSSNQEQELLYKIKKVRNTSLDYIQLAA